MAVETSVGLKRHKCIQFGYSYPTECLEVILTTVPWVSSRSKSDFDLGGVLFQRLVTSHSLVRAFVPRHYVHFFPQAEPHGTSTLYFLYCRNVFEQILDITLVLTQEVIFFGCHYFSSLSFLDLAFHSDKEPFLVLYCNRVALCHPAIIFSMWFFFHLNQDI